MSGLYYDVAAILRAAGLVVREEHANAGWQQRARSSGGFPAPPLGVWWHHTASRTTPESDAAYMATGHPDSPLGNLLIDRHGECWPIAGGASNCAGKGGPWTFSRGVCPVDSGNSRGWQIEAANDGVGEVWPLAQVDAFYLASNALNAAAGNLPADLVTHNAYAPTRKIDPARADAVPGPWAPGAVNTSGSWNVADLATFATLRATPAPPAPEEPPMYLMTRPDGSTAVVAPNSGRGPIIPEWSIAEELQRTGIVGPAPNGDDPVHVSQAAWDAVPVAPSTG